MKYFQILSALMVYLFCYSASLHAAPSGPCSKQRPFEKKYQSYYLCVDFLQARADAEMYFRELKRSGLEKVEETTAQGVRSTDLSAGAQSAAKKITKQLPDSVSMETEARNAQIIYLKSLVNSLNRTRQKMRADFTKMKAGKTKSTLQAAFVELTLLQREAVLEYRNIGLHLDDTKTVNEELAAVDRKTAAIASTASLDSRNLASERQYAKAQVPVAAIRKTDPPPSQVAHANTSEPLRIDAPPVVRQEQNIVSGFAMSGHERAIASGGQQMPQQLMLLSGGEDSGAIQSPLNLQGQFDQRAHSVEFLQAGDRESSITASAGTAQATPFSSQKEEPLSGNLALNYARVSGESGLVGVSADMDVSPSTGGLGSTRLNLQYANQDSESGAIYSFQVGTDLTAFASENPSGSGESIVSAKAGYETESSRFGLSVNADGGMLRLESKCFSLLSAGASDRLCKKMRKKGTIYKY